MEPQEERIRGHMSIDELAYRALKFLVVRVELKFADDKKYAGVSKWEIGRHLGHKQQQPTVDLIVDFLLDRGFAMVNMKTDRATYYRATLEGVKFWETHGTILLDTMHELRRFRELRSKRG